MSRSYGLGVEAVSGFTEALVNSAHDSFRPLAFGFSPGNGKTWVYGSLVVLTVVGHSAVHKLFPDAACEALRFGG